MTATANGPTPALPNTSSSQVGDGNLNEVVLTAQGAAVPYTAAATLKTTDITGGIVHYTGAGDNLTLPLATDLDAALPNAGVNASFKFVVIATTGTATVVTNTGWTTVGTLTVAAAAARQFIALKTGTGAWTLYQAS